MPGLVAPGQQAFGQWAVGQDTDAALLAEGQDGRFGLARQEAVARLQRLERVHPPGGVHLRHVEVGHAHVANLAAGDQPLERVHCLVKRVVRIPAMGLQQVDRFDSQPSQAVFGSFGNVACTQVVAAHLGREKDLLAGPGPGGQGAADQILGGPVRLGGIDQGHTQVEGMVQGAHGLRLVDAAHAATDRPGTQADYRDRRAITAQAALLHVERSVCTIPGQAGARCSAHDSPPQAGRECRTLLSRNLRDVGALNSCGHKASTAYWAPKLTPPWRSLYRLRAGFAALWNTYTPKLHGLSP